MLKEIKTIGKFKSNASGSVSNVLFTNMKLGLTLTVDAGATQVLFSNISFDSGTDLSTTLIDGLGSTNFDANTNELGVLILAYLMDGVAQVIITPIKINLKYQKRAFGFFLVTF